MRYIVHVVLECNTKDTDMCILCILGQPLTQAPPPSFSTLHLPDYEIQDYLSTVRTTYADDNLLAANALCSMRYNRQNLPQNSAHDCHAQVYIYDHPRENQPLCGK